MPRGSLRTCIGCRGKLDPSELLRFRRRRDGHVVPALGRRDADGRGAWLCPRPSCFVAAERQRSFGRAFALETHFEPRRAWTDTEARLRIEIDLLDRSAANPQRAVRPTPDPHEHPRRRALARLVFELTSQPAPPERGSTSASRKGKGGSTTHG